MGGLNAAGPTLQPPSIHGHETGMRAPQEIKSGKTSVLYNRAYETTTQVLYRIRRAESPVALNRCDAGIRSKALFPELRTETTRQFLHGGIHLRVDLGVGERAIGAEA